MPETSTAALAPPAGQVLAGPRRVLELIGNTPLIDLSELTGRPEVRLLAKAEHANPGRIGEGSPRAGDHPRRRTARALLPGGTRSAAGACSTPPRATPASPTP